MTTANVNLTPEPKPTKKENNNKYFKLLLSSVQYK